MKRIIVSLPASPASHPLLFADSLLAAGRDIARKFAPGSIHIVTDRTVSRLHGRSLVRGLAGAGTKVSLIAIPPGEASKTRAMKERLEDLLIDQGIGRDSLIIALGGGVIGDLTGFVAATLLRGIPYIQIPTTLLSQVDSSVGGKVAVDHPRGKNLIGAFYQPSAVYIVPALLQTLQEEEYRNGIAEVIKYGAILDEDLFSTLERSMERILRRETRLLQSVITRCCTLKKAVVEKDEREAGLRRVLNFGHTIGHAVEQESRYRLRHGEAVAIGMVAEAHLSSAVGLLPLRDCIRLSRLIAAAGLPLRIPPRMQVSRVVARTRQDKKVRGGVVHYTLLDAIGTACVAYPVKQETVQRLLRS